MVRSVWAVGATRERGVGRRQKAGTGWAEGVVVGGRGVRRGIRQGDGGTGPAYPPGLLWLEGRSGERRGRPPWAVEARAGPRPPSPLPPVVRRLTPNPSLTLHLSSINRLTAATSPLSAASCSLPISGRWNCPRLPVLPAAGGRRGGITSWDGDGAPFEA